MSTTFKALLDEIRIEDPWETAEKAADMLERLTPWQHVRVGVVNGKIAARATSYSDHSWEEAFRGRSEVSGEVP